MDPAMSRGSGLFRLIPGLFRLIPGQFRPRADDNRVLSLTDQRVTSSPGRPPIGAPIRLQFLAYSGLFGPEESPGEQIAAWAAAGESKTLERAG